MTPEIRSLLALVHRHYKQAHGVKYYCDRLDIPTDTLNTFCLDELGIGTKQIIAGKILERVRTVLKEGDTLRAAKAVGFSTSSGLRGFVKRNTGKTLTEYKDRYTL